VALHGLPDQRIIFFMQYFVGLKINSPIALTAFESQVSLLGQQLSTHPQVRVPPRTKRPDLRLPHRLNQIPGLVIALTYIEDEFIRQRKHRAQTCFDGVTETNGVVRDAEAADFHQVRFGAVRFSAW
jgi:hypothetical protein